MATSSDASQPSFQLEKLFLRHRGQKKGRKSADADVSSPDPSLALVAVCLASRRR